MAHRYLEAAPSTKKIWSKVKGAACFLLFKHIMQTVRHRCSLV